MWICQRRMVGGWRRESGCEPLCRKSYFRVGPASSLRPLSLKMINNTMHDLKITALEGSERLINLALAVIFDEHFLLLRSGLRVWEKPQG